MTIRPSLWVTSILPVSIIMNRRMVSVAISIYRSIGIAIPVILNKINPSLAGIIMITIYSPMVHMSWRHSQVNGRQTIVIRVIYKNHRIGVNTNRSGISSTYINTPIKTGVTDTD